MIGVPGGCVVCDREIIKDGRPTNDHTQVQVTWSNRSMMTVGVCLDCATSHAWQTDAGKKNITDWHFAYWDRCGSKYDKDVTIV